MKAKKKREYPDDLIKALNQIPIEECPDNDCFLSTEDDIRTSLLAGKPNKAWKEFRKHVQKSGCGTCPIDLVVSIAYDDELRKRLVKTQERAQKIVDNEFLRKGVTKREIRAILLQVLEICTIKTVKRLTGREGFVNRTEKIIGALTDLANDPLACQTFLLAIEEAYKISQE